MTLSTADVIAWTPVVITWITGLAWLFLVIEWLDLARQVVALGKGDLPEDLDLSAREAALSHAETVEGRALIARRVRNLLTAWGNGADPREVIALSSSQSHRANRRMLTAAAFMALVFVAAGLQLRTDPNPAWLGLALVGATLFAKSLLLGRIDGLVEARILVRLPANLPGTAVTASELGATLGASIEQSFKQYVPQPDKIAHVVGDAVERGRKAAADAEKSSVAAIDTARKAVEGLASQLAGGMTAHADKVQSILAQHSDQLSKSSQAAGQQIGAALAASNEKLQSLLASHTDQFAKASQAAGNQMSNALSASGEKLQTLLAQHADQVGQATRALSGQLDRILALEKEIEKVLHVQQAVEGAVRSVSAAEEFKQMLSALRAHLQESDQLLREASKPRTIRLVESDEG